MNPCLFEEYFSLSSLQIPKRNHFVKSKYFFNLWSIRIVRNEGFWLHVLFHRGKWDTCHSRMTAGIDAPRNAKDCWGCQKLGEGWNRFSSEPPEETNLPTTWSWTSSLQKCKRIYFCCFKPPHLWYFCTVTLGN